MPGERIIVVCVFHFSASGEMLLLRDGGLATHRDTYYTGPGGLR